VISSISFQQVRRPPNQPRTPDSVIPPKRQRVTFRSESFHESHTWLELAQSADPDGDAIPEYVERDFRQYWGCGILANGFARARCDHCGHDFLVAFSCKGRGVCPSCNTRRMDETAAHLVDHVFPQVPVRQWVLSLPKRLRYL
jgi:hypothetical protein